MPEAHEQLCCIIARTESADTLKSIHVIIKNTTTMASLGYDILLHHVLLSMNAGFFGQVAEHMLLILSRP